MVTAFTEPPERNSLRSVAKRSPPPADPDRAGRVSALYGVALLLVLALLAWQFFRAGALAEQVEALSRDLVAAREEVRMHEQRMGVVRSHVEDLSARVGALRTLVSEETPLRRTVASD